MKCKPCLLASAGRGWEKPTRLQPKQAFKKHSMGLGFKGRFLLKVNLFVDVMTWYFNMSLSKSQLFTFLLFQKKEGTLHLLTSSTAACCLCSRGWPRYIVITQRIRCHSFHYKQPLFPPRHVATVTWTMFFTTLHNSFHFSNILEWTQPSFT